LAFSCGFLLLDAERKLSSYRAVKERLLIEDHGLNIVGQRGSSARHDVQDSIFFRETVLRGPGARFDALGSPFGSVGRPRKPKAEWFGPLFASIVLEVAEDECDADRLAVGIISRDRGACSSRIWSDQRQKESFAIRNS
jgi:hypothetical protein